MKNVIGSTRQTCKTCSSCQYLAASYQGRGYCRIAKKFVRGTQGACKDFEEKKK